MRAYKYTPLTTERSFRLIQIQKDRFYGDVVEVKLTETDISNPPKYTALSYAWDTPKPDTSVICNGQKIGITKNGRSALEEFRETDRSSYFYVDAICINQNSIVERNSQVALMSDIYSNAEKVVCWLGVSAPLSYFKHGPLTKPINLLCRWAMESEFYALASQLLNSETDGNMFFWFAERLKTSTWSHRVWTVQEFALAKQVYLQAGRFRIAYPQVEKLLEYLKADEEPKFEIDPKLLKSPMSLSLRPTWLRAPERRAARKRMFGSRNLSRALKYLSLHEYARRIHQRHGMSDKADTTAQCVELLIANRSMGASEPRDKIYSIYSILRSSGIDLLPPDYERTLQEITAELVEGLLKAGCRPDFLETTCSLPPWPSWVPDLSKTPFARLNDFSSFPLEDIGKIEIRYDRLHLTRVQKIERIVKIGPKLPSTDQNSFSLHEIVRSRKYGKKPSDQENLNIKDYASKLLDFQQYLEYYYQCEVGGLAQYKEQLGPFRLFADKFSRRHPHIDSFGVDYAVKDFLVKVSGVLHKDAQKTVEEFQAYKEAVASKSYTAIEDRIEEGAGGLLGTQAFDAIYRDFGGSCIFTTESALWAVANDETREGDILVRIIGIDSLMIVRPSKDGTYRLISPVEMAYDKLRDDIRESWADASNPVELIIT